MTRAFRIALSVCLLGAGACADSRSPLTSAPNSARSMMNPSERTETEIIEDILAFVPEAKRDEARKAFHDKSRMFGSDDPRVRPLLEELGSLRLAASQNTNRDQIAATQKALRDQVLVTVSLVRSLPPNVRAVVMRRPSDGGEPILLLPEDATGDDMAFGLQLAAKSVERFGRNPAKAHRLSYTGGHVASSSTPASAKAVGTRMLALVHKADAIDIGVEGLGKVKTQKIFARAETKPSKSKSTD